MDYGKEFEKYATKHHGISSTHLGKVTSSFNAIHYGRAPDEHHSNGCFFSFDDGQNYLF